MPTWVALLRGVNVGGNNKVPMKALAAALEEDGATDVRTYLQSGNVVLDSGARSATAVAQHVHETIRASFGLSIPVVVRTGAQLAKVVAANPFPAVEDPTKLAVFFLDRKLAQADLPAVPDDCAEEVVADGTHLYVSYPNGQGRSELDHRFWNQLPKDLLLTARNWRTVTALRDLTQA